MEESNVTQTEKKPPYGILAILLVGAFVALLNNTLLNVALPTIMHDFGVSAATVQWLQTGFMLINGIVIPSTAFFIQKYTVRRLFLVAMGLFTLGTVIAGFAPLFGVLLGGRMIQAAGAAIMMPLLMNVMLTSFPPEKRGSAMGVFGLVMIFAPAIGPTLSGWIVEHYHWSVLFRMIAPVTLLILILALFKLHDQKEKVEIHLDIVSLILSTIGFGGILYSFSTAGNRGWNDPVVYGVLLAGAASLILFIRRQFKLEKPMLDFRVYRYPMFSLSTAIMITMNLALFSGMLLLPIYLQNIRGFSPLDSGLLMLPGALMMGLMSPLTGKWFDRYGARLIAIVGITILAVTSYMFGQLTDSTPYLTVMVIYCLRMMGISMVMMPVTTNGLNALPAKYYPHGTAMNNTIQQVSGALGGSLLISVMTNRTAIHAQEMMTEAESHLTGAGSEIQLAEMEQAITLQASLAGMNDAYLLSALIAGVALLLAFFLQRARPHESKDHSSMVAKEIKHTNEEAKSF
jgi:EmrB/QacA subfamily drug resistance transporter